jgi:diguanylate cyclase (GGDEF)-like protein
VSHFSSRRVALALALPVVLIAGAVFATATLERDTALRSAREQVASQSLLTAMLDQETGARGFLQNDRSVFLGPWNSGTSAFDGGLASLRSLLSGDHKLRHMLSVQVQRAEGWHAFTAAAISRLEQTGHTQSAASALQGKDKMDAFRAAHATFDVSLTRRRDARLSDATTLAVVVAIALAAIFAGGSVILMRHNTRQEKRRQHVQSELRELLQASDSEGESRDLLIRHIEKLVPGSEAAILNRNNSDDRLEITINAGDSRLDHVDISQMRPRSCLAVRLSRTHNDDPRHPGLLRCEICGATEGSSTCEPLLVGGKVIGSVLVTAKRRLDDDHLTRLQDSVAQAAPILANQRNLALAERRAASDALTGLPNRRAADQTLKRMVAHAGRSLTPLACILLDLDHFKAVNDRFGHESGDRALAMVGRIIDSGIRASDFAARFGGEEFLVLLPETDREAALLVAEKLRNEIQHTELAGMGSISASLGVAVMPVDAVEADELLRKADRSLYAAKEGGRNRVHAFSESTVHELADLPQTRASRPA